MKTCLLEVSYTIRKDKGQNISVSFWLLTLVLTIDNLSCVYF